MDVATLGEICDVLDLNNHKPGVDLNAFKEQGWAGLGLKATEGDYFTDGLFAGYLDRARALDWPVFAYHWQIRDIPVSQQVSLVRRVVPTDCPLALDVERYQANGVVVHSGGAAVSRDLVHGLQDAGYLVRFTYMPYWYYTEMGSPDLSGVPDLWGSSYGANRSGGRRDNLDTVSPAAFNGYGNVDMRMLQYTSTGQPGNLDFNVYKGTAAQFRDYLYGTRTVTKRLRRHRAEED
jgi:lysozyme